MKRAESPNWPSNNNITEAPSDESKNNSTSTIRIGDLTEDIKPIKHTTICIPEHLEVTFADYENDSILSSSRTTLDSDDDVDDDDDDKPKIPDGGYGWVVVFSSLIISMIADGVSFSFGLLYVKFLEEFGASKSTTSWIGSLFMAVPLLTGPIMSTLVDTYGCRKMTILGGLISGTGFVLSAFVDSIGVMFLTFGVIAGLGLGLCYVTAVVSIAYWFDKKRTLAVGLGASGTGIGTFIYAPMTQFFIDNFGWRGTVLLLAGTFFNMCVCGCLMKDPEWWTEEQIKQQSLRSSKKSSSNGSISGKSALDDFPDMEEIRKLLKGGKNDEYLLQNVVMTAESPDGLKSKEHHRSDFNLPTFIKQNEKVPLEVLEQLKANKKVYKLILENYPSLLMSRSTSDKGLNKISNIITSRVPVTFSMKLKKAESPTTNKPFGSPTNTKPFIGPPVTKTTNKYLTHQQSLPAEPLHEPLLARKASLEDKYPGGQLIRTDSVPWIKREIKRQVMQPTTTNYYKNIRLHRNSIMYRGAMLNIRKYRLRASSCPNIYKNSMTTLAKENTEKWYTEFLELLKGMADFSLFSEFHFLLMSLSTILLFIWFIVPYFYLAEHMTRLGYSESDASLVISVIGITNTIAMVALGWAGDQPWLHVTKTYAVCLVFCGFSCAAMLWFASNYCFLLISSASFGLFFGSSFSFTPVILVELVPLERFTTAYGLILLCQGIGNLLGPPIGGLLFDLTHTWEQSFYQAGFWIVISGLFIGVIPFTTNRKIWGTGPVEKELAASERGSFT